MCNKEPFLGKYFDGEIYLFPWKCRRTLRINDFCEMKLLFSMFIHWFKGHQPNHHGEQGQYSISPCRLLCVSLLFSKTNVCFRFFPLFMQDLFYKSIFQSQPIAVNEISKKWNVERCKHLIWKMERKSSLMIVSDYSTCYLFCFELKRPYCFLT